MRYVVLILGLVGLVGSGVLGYVWMVDCNDLKDELGPVSHLRRQPASDEMREKALEFDRRARAWPFLYGAAAVGLVGAILAFDRRRFSGMALLLAAAAGTFVFHPHQMYVLIFGSALGLAGLLAVFIFPEAGEPEFA